MQANVARVQPSALRPVDLHYCIILKELSFAYSDPTCDMAFFDLPLFLLHYFILQANNYDLQ